MTRCPSNQVWWTTENFKAWEGLRKILLLVPERLVGEKARSRRADTGKSRLERKNLRTLDSFALPQTDILRNLCIFCVVPESKVRGERNITFYILWL